jgi:condensin complex subunit 1
MSKILDILSSGLHVQTQQARKDLDHQADADTLQVHRLPLEIYAFLLSWFVDSTDRVKSSADDDVPAPKPRRGRGGKATAGRGAAKRDTWSWEQHIPITLKLIEKVLALKLQRIWMTGPERDTFL